MHLHDFWFLLIAFLWTGYFFLEGFDFGIGVLTKLLARDRTERRVLINTIGPVWDGNEVWLITAAGATFAAFPDWYATLFSGFYLPLLAILVCLILRGVAFEYRHKRAEDRWQRNWEHTIFWCSLLPAFLWGAIFANLVHGVQGATGLSRWKSVQVMTPGLRCGSSPAGAVHLPRRGLRRAQDDRGHPGAVAPVRGLARPGRGRGRAAVPRLDPGRQRQRAQPGRRGPRGGGAGRGPGDERAGARGLGVRPVRRGRRRVGRDALPGAVPGRHAVLAGPEVEPDGGERGRERLSAEDHDVGRGHHDAADHGLPGVDVLGLPQAHRHPAHPRRALMRPLPQVVCFT
ncbi:cytochrome D ubiquinol oxidase, subunit II [Streptomyces himastatinicus ATCC 53653]|uniref:Cytochrome D ubiquinol oxidase, subunit II n=1 Tax=Streptomyces himastatinicus ATCC 53653 TaxID=457427 RepID=D9W8Q2_9ACTN|nr:cytochrome D ubiquinol oxidase, subunit II [Streptomyces himastatinicus ATCC 53653]